MSISGGVFWNCEQRRLRTLWRLLLGLIILLAVGVILGLALPILWRVMGAATHVTAPLPLSLRFAARLLQTMLAVWLAGRFLDHHAYAGYGFRLNRAWWLDLAFGLALGAVLMAGIFMTEWAAGWVTVVGMWRVDPTSRSLAQALLAPLVLFLAVGIQEELLFRGYLLRNLAEGLRFRAQNGALPSLAAWLLSSAVFGLAHAANPNASLASTTNLVFAGLFLGLGYVLTGELAISIGLHVTWNLFQGSVFGFPVSGTQFSRTTVIATSQSGPHLWTGGAFGPEAGLVGFVAGAAGTLLILAWVRWRRGKIALPSW